MTYFLNDDGLIDKKQISEYTDYNEDIETGYVTDSSFGSRLGTKSRTKQFPERHFVNRKKTKSERDKRRSSRLSALDATESPSEKSSLEKTPLRYRKRSNNKRLDEDIKLERSQKKIENQCEKISKENFKEAKVKSHANVKKHSLSTATIKMNNKDIFCGTWNPKERAVLDQIIKNVECNKSNKKTIKTFLRRDQKMKKEIKKIVNEGDEKTEEEKKKKSLFSGLLSLKERVWKTEEKSNFSLFQESSIQDVYARLKKGLLYRFSRKKEIDVPRRRAQSTNDYSTIQTQMMRNKNRFGSSSSLKNIFQKTKSVDNLQGAFEYFANQNQVFRRTTSAANMDKMSPFSTPVNDRKLSKSNENHTFEPAQKDGSLEENFVEVNPTIIHHNVANHRSLRLSNSIGQYDSAYEESLSSRDYQSDRPVSSNQRHPKITNNSKCSRTTYSTYENRIYIPPAPASTHSTSGNVYKQPSSPFISPIVSKKIKNTSPHSSPFNNRNNNFQNDSYTDQFVVNKISSIENLVYPNGNCNVLREKLLTDKTKLTQKKDCVESKQFDVPYYDKFLMQPSYKLSTLL
ncbi:uncharacterized protein LOC101239045 [Hydra vulgaris]|uniref:Uncharacterized protein LOC101239045 n=1 Tax=Hydra vulgaris TaxID=6087 RepID=A0ABM4D8H0_HYDVU